MDQGDNVKCKIESEKAANLRISLRQVHAFARLRSESIAQQRGLHTIIKTPSHFFAFDVASSSTGRICSKWKHI
jgi:hypothetical protein